ncbi:hypothetical protein AWC32_18805 [Mycobacterium xenopi]|nr:hypothetical protein AWC32_18805 [Mycobacterium xenopi]
MGGRLPNSRWRGIGPSAHGAAARAGNSGAGAVIVITAAAATAPTSSPTTPAPTTAPVGWRWVKPVQRP